jgi:hypothetical protein
MADDPYLLNDVPPVSSDRGSDVFNFRPPGGCLSFVLLVGAVIVLFVLAIGGAFPFMHALSAAGVFGRGADAGMLRSVNAVTNALKANLLGFVGATIVLVIIALAVGHIVGDQRAQEKTAKLVQGVCMLVAATGFVA